MIFYIMLIKIERNLINIEKLKKKNFNLIYKKSGYLIIFFLLFLIK
jgi:hypothetical protein